MHVVAMPPLPGDAIKATLVEWLRPEGAEVAAGEPIATLEADGLRGHVVAPVAGRVLVHLHRAEDLLGPKSHITVIGAALPGALGSYRFVRARLLGGCSECGDMSPIHEMAQRGSCVECMADLLLPPEMWRDYFAEDTLRVARADVGTRASSRILGGRWGSGAYEFESGLPICRSCPTVLPIFALPEPGMVVEEPCPGCQEVYVVRSPPPWAPAIFPGLVRLLGEPGPARVATTKPVVLQCPMCGSPQPIDGTRRVVTCKHCDTDIYTPDALWSHFYPPRRSQRWWMVFDPK